MTSKIFPPLPLAGEGRVEGKPLSTALAGLLAVTLFTAAGCGNYSNEDLEYMNAVPAREDIAASMPRSMILPANEAELSRLTHDVVAAFNAMLAFLDLADHIRTFQPTSRIPNGRIWGPAPMENEPGWQWRFRVTRTPSAPENFSYWFEIQPVGAGDTWLPYIAGSFAASAGVRKGVGMFTIKTDPLRAAGFEVEWNAKGEALRELTVMYSTASFPISVTMFLELWTDAGLFVDSVAIDYQYEEQSNGQGAMLFSGTDSRTGWTLEIESRWLATGRGRADATAQEGTSAGLTRTQCWNDSFIEVYDHTEWDPANLDLNGGDPADCPEISTL
jgi:hypothetical protein